MAFKFIIISKLIWHIWLTFGFDNLINNLNKYRFWTEGYVLILKWSVFFILNLFKLFIITENKFSLSQKAWKFNTIFFIRWYYRSKKILKIHGHNIFYIRIKFKCWKPLSTFCAYYFEVKNFIKCLIYIGKGWTFKIMFLITSYK